MLTKLALNTLAKHLLAKQVGIIPEAKSQWKWGLRQLRAPNPDGVKNAPLMLEGRALREAKENKIGLLKNNQIQSVEALARKQRLGVEVGLGQKGPVVGGVGFAPSEAIFSHTHPVHSRITSEQYIKRVSSNSKVDKFKQDMGKEWESILKTRVGKAVPSGRNPYQSQDLLAKVKQLYNRWSRNIDLESITGLKSPESSENSMNILYNWRHKLNGDMEFFSEALPKHIKGHNILGGDVISVNKHRPKLPYQTRSVYLER